MTEIIDDRIKRPEYAENDLVEMVNPFSEVGTLVGKVIRMSEDKSQVYVNVKDHIGNEGDIWFNVEKVRPHTPPTKEQVETDFQQFMQYTQGVLEKHFGHLGFACFVFDRGRMNNFSTIVANVPRDHTMEVITPYVNMEKTKKRKNLRRLTI